MSPSTASLATKHGAVKTPHPSDTRRATSTLTLRTVSCDTIRRQREIGSSKFHSTCSWEHFPHTKDVHKKLQGWRGAWGARNVTELRWLAQERTPDSLLNTNTMPCCQTRITQCGAILISISTRRMCPAHVVRAIVN